MGQESVVCVGSLVGFMCFFGGVQMFLFFIQGLLKLFLVLRFEFKVMFICLRRKKKKQVICQCFFVFFQGRVVCEGEDSCLFESFQEGEVCVSGQVFVVISVIFRVGGVVSGLGVQFVQFLVLMYRQVLGFGLLECCFEYGDFFRGQIRDVYVFFLLG